MSTATPTSNAAGAAPQKSDAPAAAGAGGGAEQKTSEQKPKLKICCACPETKKLRDECVLMKGEGACEDAIEAHKKCLRDLGFKV